MTRVLSAFESVRPKGAAAIGAAPQPQSLRDRGKPPPKLPGTPSLSPAGPLVMDRTGKRIVPLQPRISSAAIETSVAYRASVDRRQAISKARI